MAKKILIVTEVFYPEGFKINNAALSWQSQGYQVDVLTLAPTYPLGKVFPNYKDKWFQKESYQGINVYRVRAVTGYRESLIKKILKYLNFMILGSIVAIFIGRKYDYIFGFNLSALTDMLPAVIIRKIYKKPFTLWAQDLWPDSVYAYGFKKTKIRSILLNGFSRFMYRSADTIAISSQGFEEKLRPYVYHKTKLNYLPNWSDDLEMTQKPIPLGQAKKVQFTFTGNIGKVQNLENIINAFCLLSDKYQDKSQLNIIGDGSNLNSLKQLADQNPNIIFYGRKNIKTMFGYYQSSDFLIVSLVNKAIFSATVPAKTQTYIAAKKPILAIINGDTANIVRDNNLGFVAKPDDIAQIRDIFTQAIDANNNTIKGFIKNCEDLTNSTFNKNKIINQLLALTTQGKVS